MLLTIFAKDSEGAAYIAEKEKLKKINNIK